MDCTPRTAWNEGGRCTPRTASMMICPGSGALADMKGPDPSISSGAKGRKTSRGVEETLKDEVFSCKAASPTMPARSASFISLMELCASPTMPVRSASFHSARVITPSEFASIWLKTLPIRPRACNLTGAMPGAVLCGDGTLASRGGPTIRLGLLECIETTLRAEPDGASGGEELATPAGICITAELALDAVPKGSGCIAASAGAPNSGAEACEEGTTSASQAIVSGAVTTTDPGA